MIHMLLNNQTAARNSVLRERERERERSERKKE
jgi:hypothetical protein